MANNRMFLVHKPTMLGVCLGKRMGWGWYDPPTSNTIADLFYHLEQCPEGDQDDYILLFEEGGAGWNYAGEEHGFIKFKWENSDNG